MNACFHDQRNASSEKLHDIFCYCEEGVIFPEEEKRREGKGRGRGREGGRREGGREEGGRREGAGREGGGREEGRRREGGSPLLERLEDMLETPELGRSTEFIVWQPGR